VNPFYFQTPRSPYYASYDDASGRTYFANQFGDCGGVQNFLVLDPERPYPQEPAPYTVWGDAGYSLPLPSGGTLNNDWDATSPPGAPVDQIGACCSGHDDTCANNMTQTACYDSGGIWQGKGTVCGQFACPGQGACCRPCSGTCEITYESQCAPPNGVWRGVNSVCTGGTCDAVCAPQPMDNDCDGDVDQADFAAFQACFNPGVVPPSQCKCFDKAGDPLVPEIGDADLTAFAVCASGPGIAGNAACAGAP
jgi:hypothetical protein